MQLLLWKRLDKVDLKGNNIGLGRDFNVPSKSTTYQVIDSVAEFDKWAKANPALAAQFASNRDKPPTLKMHCSGQVEVSVEWRSVRK